MDWAWRIVLALTGLSIARSAIYGVQWGHGGAAQRLIRAAVAAACVAPLARFGSRGLEVALGLSALLLLPYRQLLLGHLRRVTRRGLEELGAAWGTRLQREEGGLFHVTTPGPPEVWAGNVLTEVRSLHPAVGTKQTYFMLAFVVRLEAPAPFQCSLMKGWSRPQYFKSEWRRTTRMQGEMFGLSLGDLLHEGARETGGDPAALEPYGDLTDVDARFGAFTACAGTEPERLRALLAEPTLRELLLRCALQTLQFELNVTPTSVNVYTTYCRGDAQARIMALLRLLQERLDGAATEGADA